MGRLPDFLVIGAKKAGSTWLDHLLRSHPGVFLPTERKEVAYFDLFHDRGPAWYERFFKNAPEGALVGESTPEYLHHSDAPSRIERELPNARLLAIVRNPIFRAHSEWAHLVGKFAERRTFPEMLRADSSLLRKGCYAEQLRRFPRALSEGRLKVLVFEECVGNPAKAAAEIAGFLGVDPDAFVADARPRNESYVPRFRAAFAMLRSCSDWLRAQDLDFVVNIAHRVGVRRLLGSLGRATSLEPAQRMAHRDFVRTERDQLESLLGRPIAVWADAMLEAP
jgi:hypothetical protein